MRKNFARLAMFAVVFMLVLSACGGAPTATQAPAAAPATQAPAAAPATAAPAATAADDRERPSRTRTG